MREPIQSRPGEAFAAEHFGPVFERQVGGHNQAVPIVGGGDDIEQQLRPSLADGDVAGFVEDHEVELVQRLPLAEQLRDEFRDAEEPHPFALGNRSTYPFSLGGRTRQKCF